MEKYKYDNEFEIHSSKNILYPYISSPSGLESWFAEKVTVNEDHIYNIVWDDEDHFAMKTGGSLGKSIKFEFLDDDKKQMDDPNTLEFGLEKNDFTGMLYVRVVDYSENHDHEDLTDLWDSLLDKLRETVGG